ncbi:Mitochondrial carrier protein MTM1-like protein [Drosera capensis]
MVGSARNGLPSWATAAFAKRVDFDFENGADSMAARGRVMGWEMCPMMCNWELVSVLLSAAGCKVDDVAGFGLQYRSAWFQEHMLINWTYNLTINHHHVCTLQSIYEIGTRLWHTRLQAQAAGVPYQIQCGMECFESNMDQLLARLLVSVVTLCSWPGQECWCKTHAGVKLPGVWKTLIVQSYRVLWTRVGAQLARDVPFSALCGATLEPIRRRIIGWAGDEASAAVILGANFSAGFVAGTLAAATICPLDVARTPRQIEVPIWIRFCLNIFLRNLQSIIDRDGVWKGLFTGIGPRVARAGPSVEIVVSFYEVVKHALHQRRKAE